LLQKLDPSQEESQTVALGGVSTPRIEGVGECQGGQIVTVLSISLTVSY